MRDFPLISTARVGQQTLTPARAHLTWADPEPDTMRGPDRTGPGPALSYSPVGQAPPMSKTPMKPSAGLGRVTLATVLPDCSVPLTEYT